MSGASVAFLERLLGGAHLSEEESFALLHELTDEAMPPALAGGLLAALRAKGETAAEVRGFARAMRELARRPAIDGIAGGVDIVGTGGDGSGSFNISTGAALLAAAAGVPVIKHGNRSVSSKSGSADVLEALGLPLPLDEKGAGRCLEQTGFTFLFAPHYHPAMKAVAPVRAAMGVRTVFNLLGPLTNPAAPPFAVIGAYSPAVAVLMADTLAGLPVERAFVIHGEPGWDEATPCGPFLLLDVRGGQVHESQRDPLAHGIARCAPDELQGGGARRNADSLRAVFAGGDRGPHRDALVLGAALALEVTGAQPDFDTALSAAAAALDAGRGRRLLRRLAAFGAGQRAGL